MHDKIYKDWFFDKLKDEHQRFEKYFDLLDVDKDFKDDDRGDNTLNYNDLGPGHINDNGGVFYNPNERKEIKGQPGITITEEELANANDFDLMTTEELI